MTATGRAARLVRATVLLVWAAARLGGETVAQETRGKGAAQALSGAFSWQASGPLVAPVERPEDRCHAIKDPSIVRHDGRWHLFCSIRSATRTHQVDVRHDP